MKTLLIALAALAVAGCAGPRDKREYDYLLMHYEADPDNEKDPVYIEKAFNNCLASKPVSEEWEAEKAKLPTGGSDESVAAAAMNHGSKVQALVDQCMAKKGYRALAPWAGRRAVAEPSKSEPFLLPPGCVR